MFQRNFHLCHLSHFTSFQNFASYIFGPKLPFPQILRVNIVDVGFFYSYQSPSLPIKTKAQLFKSIHSGQDRGTGQVAVARSSVLHRRPDQRAKLQNEGNDRLPLWAGFFAFIPLGNVNPLILQIMLFAETVGKKTQFTSPNYNYKAHIQVKHVWLHIGQGCHIVIICKSHASCNWVGSLHLHISLTEPAPKYQIHQHPKFKIPDNGDHMQVVRVGCLLDVRRLSISWPEPELGQQTTANSTINQPRCKWEKPK